MTSSELKEIEERAEKATPGPWKAEQQSVGTSSGRVFEVSSAKIISKSGTGTVWTAHCQSKLDSYFIAHARTDIPRLIACVREMEAALREIRATHNHNDEAWEIADAVLKRFDEGEK